MPYPITGLIFRAGCRVVLARNCETHDELIRRLGLGDSQEARIRGAWERFVLRPPLDARTLSDLSTWVPTLHLEGRNTWCTGEFLKEAIEPLWREMLVSEGRDRVEGGQWVILPGGRIERLMGGWIIAAHPDVDLSGADFSRDQVGRPCILNLAPLSGVSFRGANLTGAGFVKADLRGANLSASNLRGAGFGRADLRGANLTGANLTETHLGHAQLSNADLRCAEATGAHLCNSEISGADFTGATLRDANLENVHVAKAKGLNTDSALNVGVWRE